MDLSGRGLHKIRIELLQDALQCATRAEDKIGLYHQIAASEKMDGQSDGALHTLEAALNLSKESDGKAVKEPPSTTWPDLRTPVGIMKRP